MKRLDPVIAVGLALPIVSLMVVAGISVSGTPSSVGSPVTTDLDSVALICPTGVTDTAAAVSLVSTDVDVAAVDTDGAAVYRATGQAAPGLVAGQWSKRPASITACRSALAEAWFTGVGAGPRHRSIVELVNPNAGQAVVDLRLSGPRGAVDAPDLLGMVVPPRSRVQVDLSQQTPMLGWLTLHSEVVRGQVSVSVSDRVELLAGGLRMLNWLSPQDEPSTDNLLLAPSAGSTKLVIFNPQDNKVEVNLALVTEESIFTPAQAESIHVDAGRTTAVDVTKLLRSATATGTFGVRVTSDEAVTAGLRSTSAGRLRLTSASTAITRPAGAILPVGPKTLLVAGADQVGSVLVQSFDSQGTQIDQDRVAITPGRGARAALPARATRVVVTATNTSVSASVVVDEYGVVGLTEPAYEALVPQIGPAYGG